jgi:hypothetical protein
VWYADTDQKCTRGIGEDGVYYRAFSISAAKVIYTHSSKRSDGRVDFETEMFDFPMGLKWWFEVWKVVLGDTLNLMSRFVTFG